MEGSDVPMSYEFLTVTEIGDVEKLYPVLMEAQAEFPTIELNGKGQVGQRTYKYATLPNILENIPPVLRAHGLFLREALVPVVDHGLLYLKTELIHVGTRESPGSFARLVSHYPVCSLSERNQQEIGKAITYSRRYTMSPMLGIVVEEDTDGEGASSKKAEKPLYKPVQKQSASDRKLVSAKTEQEPPHDPVTGEVEPIENPDVTLGKELLATAKKASLVVEEIVAAQDKCKLVLSDSAREALLDAFQIRSFLLEDTHDAILLAMDVHDKLPTHWQKEGTFKRLIDKREAEIKGVS